MTLLVIYTHERQLFKSGTGQTIIIIQPFITAHFQVITARFVHHCRSKQALLYVTFTTTTANPKNYEQWKHCRNLHFMKYF